MNLTNEKIKKILEGAEKFEGITTHYDEMWGYLYYSTHCMFFDGEYWTELGVVLKQVHPLADLREILTLRQRVQVLERAISVLARSNSDWPRNVIGADELLIDRLLQDIDRT